MAVFTDKIAGVESGVLYRGQLIHPLGSVFGIPYTEIATATGAYDANATVAVADTTSVPTQLVIKKVVTQDDAGFAGSNDIIDAGNWGHVRSGVFVILPPVMFTSQTGTVNIAINEGQITASP